jgi:hypothetical protein
MNAPQFVDLQTAIPSGQPTLADQYYRLNGKIIAKCAEAEGDVLALLKEYDAAAAKPATQAMACKLKALREGIAKAAEDKRHAKLLEVLDALKPLTELRSELAHSTIAEGWLDEAPVIFLKNAAESHKLIDRRTIVTIASLQDAHKALCGLVNQLGQLRKQLSGA